MKKRLFSLILSFFLMMPLAACGGNKGAGETDASDNANKSEKIEAEDGKPGETTDMRNSGDRISVKEKVLEDNLRTAYFAGGCFWGTEKYMSMVPGVIDVTSGYANGSTKTGDAPSYQEVCKGDTGFRETVMVKYDPVKVSYEMLVKAYYLAIDPTVTNRQGNDIGTQYQSGIYYVNDKQKEIAEAVSELIAKELEKQGSKLGVEIHALENFYEAEEYHQDYLVKNPMGYCHINNEEIEDMQSMFKEVGITRDEDIVE